MNKQICKYSIIRFQPYAETEEFANIGVVLYAAASKRVEFRLLEAKQHARITHFFDPVCREAFTQVSSIIRDEMERIKRLLGNGGSILLISLNFDPFRYHSNNASLFIPFISSPSGKIRTNNRMLCATRRATGTAYFFI